MTEVAGGGAGAARTLTVGVLGPLVLRVDGREVALPVPALPVAGPAVARTFGTGRQGCPMPSRSAPPTP